MKITLGQDVSKVCYYCMNTGSMSHFIGVPSLTVFLTIKCCTCHKFLVVVVVFFFLLYYTFFLLHAPVCVCAHAHNYTHTHVRNSYFASKLIHCKHGLSWTAQVVYLTIVDPEASGWCTPHLHM